MSEGREIFYIDENGNKQDHAIQDAILDDPEAAKRAALDAINKAIKFGLTEDEAKRLYGYRSQDAE